METITIVLSNIEKEIMALSGVQKLHILAQVFLISATFYFLVFFISCMLEKKQIRRKK